MPINEPAARVAVRLTFESSSVDCVLSKHSRIVISQNHQAKITMQFNPMFDPFVETGYLGYALRAIAHLQPDHTFRPTLEIRDYRYSEGELLYECLFDEIYTVADPAIERAMGRGQQVIDDLLNLMHVDARIDAGTDFSEVGR